MSDRVSNFPVANPGVGFARDSIRSRFEDHWAAIVSWIEESYDLDEVLRLDDYMLFGALSHVVLEPAIESADGDLATRVLQFSLPLLNNDDVGDAVQHRILRSACRQETRRRLEAILPRTVDADLGQLCRLTNNGQ